MTEKVCVLTAGFPTLVVCTGFVGRVSRRGLREARPLAETFLILWMHSRVLYSVDDPVLDKMVTLTEDLPTFTTFVQLLASLDRILRALV